MSESNNARPGKWDSRLYNICILIARLGLAYLFFTQLWWKLPPDFGCTNDFAFPQPAAENYWTGNGSGGLCFWMGMESIYAPQDRLVLMSDMRPAGLPRVAINIAPIAKMNALLLDNLLIPNISLFGWLIWLAEFWIFLSMLLGLFSRLGAVVAIGVVGQLYIGLANIPRPYEWEWAYGAILLLSIALLGAAAGRFVGIDARLRPRLSASSERGNRLARIALALT
ncbi:MAG: hypothetical protein J5I90_11815 [Caldilineales bacterium]|nr:hypothetical protein [Caldilineales bacterium]